MPPAVHWLKNLYQWTLHWAATPYALPALCLVAFMESSFFPIPPDVLLMVMAMGQPRRGFQFAAVASIGSVLGGIAGYAIGWLLWNQVQNFFFHYVFSRELFEKVQHLYQDHAFWTVFTAGFTPIPYKVFTIAGGVCQISFSAFVLASVLSRSSRFFLTAAFFYLLGPSVSRFIDQYFNWLTVAFTILLIGGFAIIKLAVNP